jgi:hypothetical protein
LVAVDADSLAAAPVEARQAGEVIRWNKGQTLHVNAMRIGYTPAVIDYIDGKVVGQEKKVR